jgi:hypothetical protein
MVTRIRRAERKKDEPKAVLAVPAPLVENHVSDAQAKSQKSATQSLAEKIRLHAGFELFNHCGDRGDLNDYHGPQGKGFGYVRGVHNVQVPYKITQAAIDSGGTFDQHATPDFDVVLHGKLSQSYEREVVLKKKMSGFLGIIGFTQEEVERKPITRPYQLSELITSIEDGDAYCIHMLIRLAENNRFFDGAGRVGSPPVLTIACSSVLAKEIIGYLAANPTEYYGLMQMLLPRNEFPNINGKMLDNVCQGPGLTLVPMHTVPRTNAYFNPVGYHIFKPAAFTEFGEYHPY